MIVAIREGRGVPEEIVISGHDREWIQSQCQILLPEQWGSGNLFPAPARPMGLPAAGGMMNGRDLGKINRAAANHLRDLYQRFDNWYLAIAGYNYSPGKIEKRLQRYNVEEFWDLPACHGRPETMSRHLSLQSILPRIRQSMDFLSSRKLR